VGTGNVGVGGELGLQIVMGLGQKFLTQVGSAIFGLGLENFS